MTDAAVALFVALLVVGAMNLPRMADAIGRAVRRISRDGQTGGRADPPPR